MPSIFYLAIFTISFDIFLAFKIGGFTVRANQLFMVVPLLGVFLGFLLKRNKINLPLGCLWLIFWTLSIIAFVPNTNYLIRNISYSVWLVFNVLVVFIIPQLFNNPEKILKLTKIYLFSFTFVALFGLIQFFFGLLGLPAPLVTDWWLGNIPRINGFSYEPSYFSTYLLMGWVLLIYFYQKRFFLVKQKTLTLMLFIVTLAMLLSGSRMGWLMMIVWLLQHPFMSLINFLKGKIKKTNLKYVLSLSILAFFGIVMVIRVIGLSEVMFLLDGIGIADRSSHSASTRTNELKDTLAIFKDSPFLGHSLGGVATAIGGMRGVEVNSTKIAKDHEGMSIFAEVLAASGIFGFIPFLIYFIVIIFSSYFLSKKIEDQRYRILLRGFIYSLILEIMVLQFNQNILRPYLWLHIGILSAIYGVLKQMQKMQRYSRKQSWPFQQMSIKQIRTVAS